MSDKRTLEQTISLQLDEAIGSLRSLKAEVKQVTDAWKLQYAQLRQNGEYEEAYREKVKGLEQSLSQQHQGIEQLVVAMNSFTSDTKAGAEAHAKLAQELLKAERGLQSTSSQLEKAQNILSLYESGVIQARRELEQSEKVSVSYQEKLRAEGREVEANVEKRRFLAEKVKGLTDLQEKETSILEKIKTQSGEASDAFRNQTVRVNELAAKVAHTKTEFNELDRAITKKPTVDFGKLKEQLGSLNEKAEKTHQLFGKILGADLLSRAAFSGFISLKEEIKEATKAGFEFNQEQQVMLAAWNTLTNDAVKAREMIVTINDLSVATGRSRDLVNELEQGFYHLHSNKEESDNLTKSMLNMGDAVGLTDDKLQTVTQDMVHGLASGKLTLQELNQLGRYFPMFTEQLAEYVQKHKQATEESSTDSKAAAKAQKAYVKEMTAQFEAMHYGSKISQQDIEELGKKSILSGEQIQEFQNMQQQGQKITTSMIKQAIRVNSRYISSVGDSKEKVAESSDDAVKHLRELVHQGKISATEVEEVFNYLGQDKYGKAAENMLQTMTGMKRTINSQVPALIGAFEKPILTAQNPFYGAVSKWVSDHKTQDKFTEMGNSAEKGVEIIIASFEKVMHPGSSVNMADQVLDSLNQHIQSGSQYIADHAPQIIQFLSQTKETAVGLFTRGEATLKGFYEIASPLLEVVRRYPKQVGELMAVMYLAKPAISGVTLAMKGFEIFKKAIGWISELRKEIKLFNATKVLTPDLSMGESSSKSGGVDPSLFVKNGGKAAELEKGVAGVGKAAELEEGAASAGKLAGLFGKFGKLLPVAGVAIAGLTELIGMTKSTAGRHIGGALGSVGGAAGGAALGSMILPGIGTVVGGALGAFGGSALGKKLGAEVQKGLKAAFASKTPLKDAFTKDLGQVSTSVDKELMKVATSTDGFTKDEKTKIDQLYSELDKKTDKYFQDKQKNSKKDLKLLVDNGVLTREQADKMLKDEQQTDKKKSDNIKNAYANQKKITENYYNDYNGLVKSQKENEAKLLDTYAKKYGKDSKEYAKEKLKIEQDNKKELDKLHNTYFAQLQAAQTVTDETINKELDKNGKKQAKILENLKETKHKISLKEAQEAIQSSSSATNKIIKNAESLYSEKKKTAEQQYKETVEAAKKERDESGTISDSQYKEIVEKAKRQRDDSIEAAKDQKDKTVKAAQEKHQQVVDEATKQAGEHKDALDTETGYVKGSVEDQGVQQAKGINAIIDGIDWVWKLFTGHKTKIPYLKIPGHKDGLNRITHGEIAVVGEEGFELAHHPSKGIYPVGLKGEEVRYLEPQTSILPHEQSKQFLSMTQGLPHYKNGVGDFFSTLFDDAKDLVIDLGGEAKEVWKTISGGVGKAWDFLLKKFHFTDWFKQESSGELGKGTLGLSLKEAGHAAQDLLKSLFDFVGQHTNEGSSSGGNHVGSWEPQIKKAASSLGLTLAPWQIQNLLKQIQTESGGNEKIIQSPSVVDINTLSGNPAKGLLQFIPQTFAQWALPGHTNIFSGFDQILAAIRRLNAMGTWNYIGQGHGWERGGFISRHGYYELGENGQEEAIIPLNKGMRSLDMLYKTMNKLGVHREVKVEVPQENSSDKLLPVLLEILSAVKASRNISMNIGDQMINVLDAQLGSNHFQHSRLDLGGGTVG